MSKARAHHPTKWSEEPENQDGRRGSAVTVITLTVVVCVLVANLAVNFVDERRELAQYHSDCSSARWSEASHPPATAPCYYSASYVSSTAQVHYGRGGHTIDYSLDITGSNGSHYNEVSDDAIDGSVAALIWRNKVTWLGISPHAGIRTRDNPVATYSALRVGFRLGVCSACSFILASFLMARVARRAGFRLIDIYPRGGRQFWVGYGLTFIGIFVGVAAYSAVDKVIQR